MNNFWNWWQQIPADLSPYLLQTEYFSIHYYGLMYVVGFSVAFLLIYYRLKYDDFSYKLETILDFFIWVILGIIIGGRLGYVFFYKPIFYLSHPLQIITPFELAGGHLKLVGIRGMSYHGGLIGAVVSVLWFCKNNNIDFWKFTDLAAPAAPLGYMFGRIGNFINQELYGRVTEMPWGMYFQNQDKLRHPSQLYEAVLEGLVIFLILWPLRNKDYLHGKFLALYIILYGIARFIVEFFRQPDPFLGFILGPLTMGQILSSLMIIAGLWLFYHRKITPSE
ncbi:MAG: prolipoprotein diacylglyceryl transferase [Candidatus Paceibacteria bacterium]